MRIYMSTMPASRKIEFPSGEARRGGSARSFPRIARRFDTGRRAGPLRRPIVALRLLSALLHTKVTQLGDVWQCTSGRSIDKILKSRRIHRGPRFIRSEPDLLGRELNRRNRKSYSLPSVYFAWELFDKFFLSSRARFS